MFEPRQRRDTDEIEFDFFDDAPTREATEAERDAAPAPAAPRRPPTGGPPPQQLRLAALVIGLVVLVVLLIVWVSSCQSDKTSAYEDYMTDVSEVTSSSDRIGRDLRAAIARPGIKLGDLEQALDGLRAQQAQLVAEAQELDPPGPLRRSRTASWRRCSSARAVSPGSRRVSRRPARTAAPRTGTALAEQAKRFVASDVVYDDLFRDPLAGDHARGGCRRRGGADVLLPQHAQARRGSTWTRSSSG